jgi:diguanylate cyclase (GGDEF)-like protein
MTKNATSLRHLVCAAVLLLCLAFSFVVVAIWQLRVDEFNDAYSETSNLGNVLAGQLSRFLEGIDLVLTETKSSVQRIDSSAPDDWRRAIASPEIHGLLTERLTHLPQAFNIAVADAAGQVIDTTAAWPAPAVNIADRDYFAAVRDDAGNGLIISAPIKNRINGDNTIVFARRLSAADGAFIGTVYVAVNTSYFEVIYESLKSVRNLKFTLVHQNGTVLLRYPNSNDRAGQKIPLDSPWYAAVAKGGGSFRSPAIFDGEVRLVSVQLLQGFPLAVSVSTLEDAALARWHRRILILAIASLVFLSSSIYLLFAVAGKIRSLSKSESALRQKSEALENSNMRFDAALNNMSQGLCMFDADQRVVVANARYREVYGLTPDQVKPGTSLRQILARRAANAGYRGTPAADATIKLANSSEIQSLADGRVVSVLCNSMPDGGWITTHEDVTDRQRNEARVAFMAHHDLLTGLANRASFTEEIEGAGARLRRHDQAFTVFMIDLDRFKTVNDTLGHPAGDALLKETALRLKSSLRDTDILARLGGDEFAIIQIGDADQVEAARSLANRIVDLIAQPYDLDGGKVTVSASIGIALAPNDGDEPNELLKKADIALYRTKAEGRNGFNFFRPDMLEQVHARHELENEMREAISRNEFELHYQPVVNVKTRQTCGMEALVRWRHPQRGLVMPDDFIPLAEETGLIIPLGNWILQQACVDAASWPPQIMVAVNLSPLQLKSSNLLDVLQRALDVSGLPAERLEVEITESALLHNEIEYLDSMRKLKAAGISIALDDFGTGCSSLSHLTMFPFDKIKIDKWFTQNLTKRADCAAIVSAILALGSGLEIMTVAEGIETKQQFELLRAAGVNFVQGYLFGRPMPLSELDFNKGRKTAAIGSAA